MASAVEGDGTRRPALNNLINNKTQHKDFILIFIHSYEFLATCSSRTVKLSLGLYTSP